MDPSLRLPPVYPITPERLRAEELMGWAERLLSAGCRFFQYRRKTGTDRARHEELSALLALAKTAGARVVVDDRPDLCLLCGADGVHLGQGDLPAEEARRLLPRGRIVGFSTHGLEQFLEAREAPVDYLALGPVFPTASKEGADPVVPVPVQEEVIRLSPVPVVAIGGITPEGAPSLWARGFASVAVIGALEADPAGAWGAFMEARGVTRGERREA
jgi:thiamine-phosphate pyrophosphorylase